MSARTGPALPPALQSLPSEVKTPLEKVLASEHPARKAATEAFVAAFRALDFPAVPYLGLERLEVRSDARHRGVMPHPDMLTPPQRALVGLLQHRDDVDLHFHDARNTRVLSLPETAACRRRWLGLEGGGPLLEPACLTVDGEAWSDPGWRICQRAHGRLARVLAEWPLPDLLAVYGELCPISFGLELWVGAAVAAADAERIDGEHGAWAAGVLDRLATRRAGGAVVDDAERAVRLVAFTALVRAGVPAEPRWDPLIPCFPNPNVLRRFAVQLAACWRAIPEERRGTALTQAARAEPWQRWLLAAELLREFPSADLARMLLDSGDGRWALQVLRASASPEVQAVAEAIRAAARGPALRLTCGARARISSLETMGPVQLAQLSRLARSYDGDTRPLQERIHEEPFSEVLEYLPITDTDTGTLAYEAYVLVDTAAVFVAGTDEEVASIIQGSVDRCLDLRVQSALIKALEAERRARSRARPTRPGR